MKIFKNYFTRVLLLLGCSFVIFQQCNNKQPQEGEEVKYRTVDCQSLYEENFNQLFDLVSKMKEEDNLKNLKKLHVDARLALKKTEPFIAYERSALYKALNQPNLPTIEEDSNGVQNIRAQGFQVLEELMFEEKPNLEKIKAEIDAIYFTLKLEKNNYKIQPIKDYQFLLMFRNEIWRILSQGIVGFDSPMLSRSMPESAVALSSLKAYIEKSEPLFKNQSVYNQWINQLDEASNYLNDNQDFDTFNRYDFVKNYLQPMLSTWKATVDDWNVEFPLSFAIENNSKYFFGKDTFRMEAFAPSNSPKITDEIVSLGKSLFNDASLSNEGEMSCATCHVKGLYFTDNRVKGQGINGETLRNVPTMLYAGLQREQFYDGRVALLENQITDVAENPNEFHTNMDHMLKVVKENKDYQKSFSKLYKNGLNEKNIRNAIAAYIRSLNPFNSKFDKNMRGEVNSITEEEKLGFNLFMGKGACATCHFAPVFNGTIPPEFNHTEYEVLGVPKTPIWKNAKVDDDLGRYNLHKAEKRKYAFKTPTVRNVEKTAPYMHNGVYTNLEEVIEFYTVGGGQGIGISLENQTLPFDELNLNNSEKKALVAFLKSLTDEL